MDSIEFGPDPASDPGDAVSHRRTVVVRGAEIVITYHLNRWGEQSHSQHWRVSDLSVHVRFRPLQQYLVQNLRRDPSDMVFRSPAVTIPSDCEEFEVWFRSVWSSVGGEVVERWDSRYGSNYRFKTEKPESRSGGVF